MKLSPILALCGVLALGACAHQSPGQVIEATDVSALSLYGQIGSTLDAYEKGSGNVTAGEAIRVKAWSALQTINSAYKAGQAVDLSPLTAILSQVKGL